MSTPAIQYSGPKIDPSVPWEVSRHLQQIYQKLNNHTQAFGIQQGKINGLKSSTTTNTTIEAGGGSSGGGSSFLGQGLINDQSGQTGYATAPSDNGILLILNDASPVAVSLTTDAAPFYLFITNFGAGTATLAPSTGTINGGASLALLQNQTVLAECDSTNWKTTAIQVTPHSLAKVTHEWLDSYSAATGLFTQSQPAYSDISGTPTLPVTIAPVANTFLTGYNSATGTFSAAVAPVISVFGRTGAVAATTGDYTAAQVTHALDLSNAGTQTMTGTLALPVGQSINVNVVRDASANAVYTAVTGIATFRNPIVTPAEDNTAPQTTVSASGSGSVIFSQPQQGSSWKKTIIYLVAATGTASYTFPVAFSHVPAIVSTNGPAATVVTALSVTAVTVTGSATTGFIILEGF